MAYRSFTLVRQDASCLELIAKTATAYDWIENVIKEPINGTFDDAVKDGVIFCKLLMAISPGSIKKINFSKVPFKMLENLEFFRAGLEAAGVKGTFDIANVLEGKNMLDVVNCIHELAKIAASHGFLPQMESLELSSPTIPAASAKRYEKPVTTAPKEQEHKPTAPQSHKEESHKEEVSTVEEKPKTKRRSDSKSRTKSEHIKRERSDSRSKKDKHHRESSRKERSHSRKAQSTEATESKVEKEKPKTEPINEIIQPETKPATEPTEEPAAHAAVEPAVEKQETTKMKETEIGGGLSWDSDSSLESDSTDSTLPETTTEKKKRFSSFRRSRAKKSIDELKQMSLPNLEHKKKIETEVTPEVQSRRRTFATRRAATATMKDIESYYKTLKEQAEKMNNAGYIQSKIQENHEKEANEPSNQQRMEMRDLTSGEENGEEDKRERMRISVVNEILLSEKSYVKDLKIAVDLFKLPLKEANIINPAERAFLFSNIELILDVNTEILSSLINDLEKAGTIQLLNVGACILKMVEILKIYSIYAANQTTCIEKCVQYQKEKPKFSAFCEKTEALPECRGNNLLSFLIKPVQRICKYPMLIKELLKFTPEEHSDYKHLGDCLKRMEEVAMYVNEQKRLAENKKKILEIEKNLTNVDDGTLTQDNSQRTFVKEGTLGTIDDKNKQIDQYWMLFNDILIFCKPKFFQRATFQLKGKILLKNCVIDEDFTQTEEGEFAFQIIEDDEKKIVLICESEAEKREWMNSIRTQVESVK